MQRLFLFILLCISISTSAQNQADWLPPANEMFFDGIEVLEVSSSIDYPEIREEQFGDVSVDYVNFTTTLADGRIITLPDYWYDAYDKVSAVRSGDWLYWHMDISGGSLPRIGFQAIDLRNGDTFPWDNRDVWPTLCGEVEWGQIAPMIVIQNSDESYQLCDIATGERYDLPSDGYRYGWIIPTYTPDRSRIVFAARQGSNDDISSGRVLIFHLDDKTLTELHTPYLSPYWDYRWLNGRYLYIDNHTLERYFDNRGANVIDVQEDRVVAVLGPTRRQTRPFFSQDPLSLYGYFGEWDETSENFTHCWIDSVNIETGETSHFDMGSLCKIALGGYYSDPIPNYYLIEMENLDNETITFRNESFHEGDRALVYYDEQTGQSEVVYAGAIEKLVDISDDGQIAILNINEADEAAIPFYHEGYSDTRIQSFVVNLETNEIYYPTDAPWTEEPGRGLDGFEIDRAWWADSDEEEGEDTLYYVSPDGIRQTIPFPENVWSRRVSDDWMAYGAIGTASWYGNGDSDSLFHVELYNIFTGQNVALMAFPPHDDIWHFDIQSLASDTFEITIRQRRAERVFDGEATYTVRIPSLP